jgi:hypothetical protein
MSLFLFQPAERRRNSAPGLSVVVRVRKLSRACTRTTTGLDLGPATGLHLASFQVPAQSLGKPLLALTVPRAFSLCGIISHRRVA